MYNEGNKRVRDDTPDYSLQSSPSAYPREYSPDPFFHGNILPLVLLSTRILSRQEVHIPYSSVHGNTLLLVLLSTGTFSLPPLHGNTLPLPTLTSTRSPRRRLRATDREEVPLTNSIILSYYLLCLLQIPSATLFRALSFSKICTKFSQPHLAFLRKPSKYIFFSFFFPFIYTIHFFLNSSEYLLCSSIPYHFSTTFPIPKEFYSHSFRFFKIALCNTLSLTSIFTSLHFFRFSLRFSPYISSCLIS